MQELVKEVTLKNMDLQFGMELSFLPRRYNFLTLSVLMHISLTLHYNAGHSYKINKNTGADEFVAWKCFLPGRISSLTFSVLMSPVLTNYVSVLV